MNNLTSNVAGVDSRVKDVIAHGFAFVGPNPNGPTAGGKLRSVKEVMNMDS